MKKFCLTVLVFSLFVQAATLSYKPQDTIKTTDFEGFKPYLHQKNDTTYVINFFATWCIPCREEMPDFVKVSEEMEGKKVSFLFVSLDFPSQVESRLIPFIKEYKMADEVILLDDPDQNAWIDQVSPAWSGGIPATLIYKNNQRLFLEKMLSYKELKMQILNISN